MSRNRLSLFVREGRWMVDVARKSKRVVQVGTQQRSGPHYAKAAELIRRGDIGQVVAVRMWSYRNIMPGFGSPPDGDPPPGLDYDLWLGPAPEAAVQPQSIDLPFPLVLGLLRRADDEPGPSLARHRPLVPRRDGSPGRHQQRRPVRAPGQRRDARHAGRPARVRRLDRDLVAPRGQPRRRADPGPGVLRHRGEPHDLAEGLHADAGPEDPSRAGRAPVRRRTPDGRTGLDGAGRQGARRHRRPWRTAPATSSTSSAATRGTSSTASARASSPSRTSRPAIASRRHATWRTSRCGSAAS